MAFSSCLTNAEVLVVAVSYFADRGSAVHSYLSYFSGRKSYLSELAFLSHQLSSVSGCSYHLCAFARFELDVVDDSTERNVCQRQSVSYFDICLSSRFDHIADLEVFRCDDVSLFTVCVYDQSDVCAAVRVIFDRCYLCRDTVLLSLEVDDPVLGSVSAASVSDGDLASYVSSGMLLQGNGERFFRFVCCDLFKC